MQALRAAHQTEVIERVDPRDLVFIDESGCNRAMTRLYARSLCGTRARGTAPRNWGDNVSIVSALTLHGPLATMHMAGAINGEAFLLYLDEFLLPKLWPGAVVVMDNLSAHKVKAVRAKIEAKGARLVYLPPYSPDFNPIELAWSKLKSHLRRVAARTKRMLARAIREGLARIRPANARAYFAHCGYRGLPT